ncbi:hypothetical protein ABZ783_34345 [Micromonospora sp. NPDC047738]|uniref:hypothetical protein n=1 Tax=Micromonospora sp. NPDC047738 TaxID=3155741 RepID=UPI0033C1DCD5
MIDYCAHVLSLNAIRQTLDSVAPSTPYGDAWSATRAAVDAEPGCALLGALVDHLLERSDGVEREHDLLEEGASVYALAADAMSQMAKFRSEFERMAKSPATASLERYRELIESMRSLEASMSQKIDQVKDLKKRAMPPYSHIPPHGASEDQPVESWLWRDVVLSRRTDALVREVEAAGDGTPTALAFSFGAATSYASNCIGSSYLTATVGGPRRSHGMRDRVARYVMGGWLRAKAGDPTIWPSFSKLREALVLENGASPKLPDVIETQILTALDRAFPAGAGGPAAAPDLQAGYAKLLRHLELLDSFPRLPIPPDIDAALLQRTMEGAIGGGGGEPNAADVLQDPQQGISAPTDGLGDPQPPVVGAEGKVGDNGCFGLLLVLLCVTIVGIIIVILIADDSSGENPSSSRQALTRFLESDNACKVAAYAFHAHTQLYESASVLLQHFKRIGLLYPDEFDFTDPLAQFTHLPAKPGLYPSTPVTPAPGTEIGWHLLRPSSRIEEPVEDPSLYPASSTPAVVLEGTSGGPAPTVGEFGAEVWLRHQPRANPGESDINLNADADRGFGHQCWRVPVGHSIQENPVPVEILEYLDVT